MAIGPAFGRRAGGAGPRDISVDIGCSRQRTHRLELVVSSLSAHPALVPIPHDGAGKARTRRSPVREISPLHSTPQSANISQYVRRRDLRLDPPIKPSSSVKRRAKPQVARWSVVGAGTAYPQISWLFRRNGRRLMGRVTARLRGAKVWRQCLESVLDTVVKPIGQTCCLAVPQGRARGLPVGAAVAPSSYSLSILGSVDAMGARDACWQARPTGHANDVDGDDCDRRRRRILGILRGRRRRRRDGRGRGLESLRPLTSAPVSESELAGTTGQPLRWSRGVVRAATPSAQLTA